jgi:hypothetical protein
MVRNKMFRAWDTFSKQWIAKDFHILGEVMCFHLIDSWLDEHPNPEKQGSLSRLNDVEITEFVSDGIYENDIVEFWGGVGVVVWNEEHTGFCVEKDGDNTLNFTAKLCKRIGNIYEDGDLLL